MENKEKFIESFVGILKSIQSFSSNPLKQSDFLYVQKEIIKNIIEIENINKSYKREKSITKSKIKTFTYNGDLEDIKKQQEKLRKIDDCLNNTKYFIKAFRLLGDELAWGILPERVIRNSVMASDKHPGFISESDGFDNELRVAERLTKKGNFVLINDITSSVRVGDLSLFGEDEPTFIEVKSSLYGDSRVIRQMERLMLFEKLFGEKELNEIETNKLFSRKCNKGVSGGIKIIKLDYESSYNKNVIKKTTEEAMEKGKSLFFSPDGIVGYACFRDGQEPFTEGGKELSDQITDFISKNDYDHKVISFGLISARVNDHYDIGTFLHLFDPGVNAELIFGEFDILTFFNDGAFLHALSKKGVEGKLVSDGEYKILKIPKKDMTIDITYRLKSLLYNGLSAESLIEYTEKTIRNYPGS